MKNIGLLGVIALSLVFLAGCNCKCDDAISNENEGLDKATQYCVDNGGTHSLIHSQTAVYGECALPNGVTCDDQEFLAGECQDAEYQEPDLSNIDTEEKRLALCEESVNNWIDSIEKGELMDIEREDESEGGASFVRNGMANYIKEGGNRKVTLECVADFVDGSLSVMYGDPSIDG